MNLKVIAPGYFETQQIVERRFWLYMASCRKFGITPTFYGVGATSFQGGGYMRLHGQMAYLRTLDRSVTHILFSDGWDAMYLQPLEVIIERYQKLGSPPWLIGSTRWGWLDLSPPESDEAMALPYFDTPGVYRWPSTTFWIGEPAFIANQIGRIGWCSHNECMAMLEAFRENRISPTLDTGCEIFQEKGHRLPIKDGRLYNPDTDTFPCLCHMADGNTDGECGKDDRIIPTALRLGIITQEESDWGWKRLERRAASR